MIEQLNRYIHELDYLGTTINTEEDRKCTISEIPSLQFQKCKRKVHYCKNVTTHSKYL